MRLMGGMHVTNGTMGVSHVTNRRRERGLEDH